MFDETILTLKETDSTNSYAGRWLAEARPPEGTTIVAESQTEGRGRRGADWHAEAGLNLTCSMILYPRFLPLDKIFFLNIIASLSAAAALKDAAVETEPFNLTVKWPNDIYVENQKIGGILIENQILGGTLETAIIGIGLNVNSVTFPPDLAEKATSLRMWTKRETTIEYLVERLRKWIEYYYLQGKDGRFETLHETYRRALYRLETLSLFVEANGARFWGKIKDIRADGKLCVVDENEIQRYFDINEIQFA